MAIKKYHNGAWETIPYKRYETSTDTLTTLPAEVIADGNNATVGLAGNMSQTGTPTPQNPIEPSETGERTGNLCDESKSVAGAIKGSPYTAQDYGMLLTSELTKTTEYIKISPNTQYTFSCKNPNPASANSRGYAFYDNNKQVVTIGANTLYDVADESSFTVTIPNGATYIRISWDINATNIMFNEGSIALPYEPYGIKIPILNNSQTTNVYLGEVQSTRNIKKLVFDGTEEWRSQYGGWVLTVAKQSGLYTVLSTHYIATLSESIDKSIYGNSTNVIIIFDSDYSTLNDFKAYLSQQYAAGTPVCVWYVLATPQTAVVNEPIRKMGDYVDTVSGITVPTLGTSEQFDVDTTLKPSEVQLTYTGWHNKSDTKF